MRLNLGCCNKHYEDFCNVDLFPPADLIADLRRAWPWRDGCIEMIVAEDIFEHLPDKIHTMNEAWRVLRRNGLMSLSVPTTDGRGAFQDPTHCSYWTPNDLFYYTDGDLHRERFKDHYGIDACFRVMACEHVEAPASVWQLDAILQAVK